MDVFFRNGKNAVLRKVNIMKREGQVRIPSGCAISAVISREGRRMTGEKIVESMIPMHDRSNGLGGGFAAYGIYPEYRDYYAFHIFFDSRDTRKTCEALLKEGFEIVKAEHIPIRQIPEITDVPLIWRYFLAPMQSVLNRLQLDAEEYVARIVTKINAELRGAYVFSSGKNMGTFKAVGYPEDVGRFYRLEEYEAYCWTAHGRYPTNTPGWWAVPTRSPCWSGLWCTTARSHLMTPTAAAWRCSAISARCKRIRRSWRTSRTTCCGGRD